MSFSVKKCTHWCFFLYQVNFVCPSCVVKSVFKKEVECVKKIIILCKTWTCVVKFFFVCKNKQKVREVVKQYVCMSLFKVIYRPRSFFVSSKLCAGFPPSSCSFRNGRKRCLCHLCRQERSKPIPGACTWHGGVLFCFAFTFCLSA